MRYALGVLSLLLLASALPASAQHPHETPGTARPTEAARPMEAHGDPLMMRMMETDPYHMRAGSGTAWHPESTPVAAFVSQVSQWIVMAHGAAWLTWSHLESPRGDTDEVVSQNWLMLMGQRPVAGGALMLRSMLSLEAASVGGAGYPLLFQTGESWRGKPLLDSQHPHDLFMELAADYSRPLSRRRDGLRWNVYGAIVGEPALGPEAYMHRQSAVESPLAPLSHHWQDSTHITWGVLTLGLGGSRWKVEASAFNGHEPNENRWSPDALALNSVSARLWYVPNENWSAQVSTGRLDEPEALEPGDLTRHTASLQYNRPSPGGNLAAAAIWGQNREEHGVSDSWLLESTWKFGDRNHVFGRAEWVRKRGLFLEPDPRHDTAYNIGAFTLGYARDIREAGGLVTAAGIQGMAFQKPAALDEVYGRRPWAIYAFVRIRPKDRPAMQHRTSPMPPAGNEAA